MSGFENAWGRKREPPRQAKRLPPITNSDLGLRIADLGLETALCGYRYLRENWNHEPTRKHPNRNGGGASGLISVSCRKSGAFPPIERQSRANYRRFICSSPSRRRTHETPTQIVPHRSGQAGCDAAMIIIRNGTERQAFPHVHGASPNPVAIALGRLNFRIWDCGFGI
jgi:hypothetical protein